MHFYIAWTVVDRFWYRKLVGKWGVWHSHYLIHFGNSPKDLLPWCSGCHLPKCCSLTCDVNKMMIFNMLSVQDSKVIMLIKKRFLLIQNVQLHLIIRFTLTTVQKSYRHGPSLLTFHVDKHWKWIEILKTWQIFLEHHQGDNAHTHKNNFHLN